MELDYKAIGKRIKIARIKADLTQEKLSEMVGVSPTHLSNIETGTTRVSLNAIISIANALHITSDDLLCDNVVKAKVQFEKDIALILEAVSYTHLFPRLPAGYMAFSHLHSEIKKGTVK